MERLFRRWRTQIVLVEGNYLTLDSVEPWSKLSDIFNERWFVQCDVDVAMERVYRRHIETGKTPAVARERCDSNDRINAIEINSTQQFADRIIVSE